MIDPLSGISARSDDLARRVETFVRSVVIPYERDARFGPHGPSDELVDELREKARAAGLLTPHILPDGSHLTQRETAVVLRRSGLSLLGPVALNTGAPDEGNMYLLGKVATPAQRQRFLSPLVSGRFRSSFFMTEPSEENGAGSDPSMLTTTATRDGEGWRLNGRKAFITGAQGARVGLVMAKADAGATLFLIELPNDDIHIERALDTIDGSMPGRHCVVRFDSVFVPDAQVLGEPGQGFELAQVRLSPARLSHCMRWLGAATRAHELATAYAVKRHAFGKPLIDHEGVGFMLADNVIALKQAELMVDWCAGVLDTGVLGTAESSMTKVAVSEGLFAVADRCVQVMGGRGVSREDVVEQVFRELRAFRIYDGPSEVHRWSLAKRLKKSHTS